MPHQWRIATVSVLGAMVGALVLFWGTAQSIVAIWYRSGTFSHGFLILPISLYLVWLCRRRLALLQPMPSRAGLLLLGILGFGWLLGDLTGVLVVQQLALNALHLPDATTVSCRLPNVV